MVVLIQCKQFNPMALVVLQGPCDKTECFWNVVRACVHRRFDASHLLGVCDGINDMSCARRNQIHHLQALLLEGGFHQLVGLKEHVLVPDGSDGRHHRCIGGIVHRVQHVKAQLLMEWQRTHADEPGDGCFREMVCVDITAIGPERGEVIRML